MTRDRTAGVPSRAPHAPDQGRYQTGAPGGERRTVGRRAFMLLLGGSIAGISGAVGLGQLGIDLGRPARAQAPAVPTPARVVAPPRRVEAVAGAGDGAAAEPPSPVTHRPSPAPEAQAQVLPVLPESAEQRLGLTAKALPPERLVIPGLELDARVVPLGVTRDKDGRRVWETAAFAVGHHRGTGLPGQPGNIVLSGHISSRTEGAVFKRLPEIKPGMGVVVFTAQRPFVFQVAEKQVVLPTAVEVIEPTAESVLTLITCVPDGVYSHRLIVRCEAV